MDTPLVWITSFVTGRSLQVVCLSAVHLAAYAIWSASVLGRTPFVQLNSVKFYQYADDCQNPCRYGTRKLVSQRRSQCRRPAFAHECQQDQGTQAQRLCTLILLAFRCKSWSTALWTVKSTCKYWHQLSASSARHAISSLLLTAGCQWLTILCQSVVQHRLWWMRRSR